MEDEDKIGEELGQEEEVDEEEEEDVAESEGLVLGTGEEAAEIEAKLNDCHIVEGTIGRGWRVTMVMQGI